MSETPTSSTDPGVKRLAEIEEEDEPEGDEEKEDDSVKVAKPKRPACGDDEDQTAVVAETVSAAAPVAYATDDTDDMLIPAYVPEPYEASVRGKLVSDVGKLNP